MTKFSITTILLLLLTRFTVATDAVNPISKFLMMGNSNSRSHGGARGEEGVDDAELLVHAKQLVEQVQAAEASRDQALKDQQAASAALATLQIDMEDLRKDTGVRIEQLSQSSDAAQQVVQVQEQAAKRMEEVKVRFERELAEANELSAKREGELKAQYERELSEATDAIAGATDAIAETEAELKDQHRRALMEARDVSAQREAELKNTIEQKESEMASATAIDTEFAEANVELVKKNEELTARIQELDALQKDGSQRIDEGKEEVRVQLQQEIDEMTAKNSKYIEKLGGQLSAVKQERNNLQKLNADQDEKASQMQEESRQALNAALAEHEKEVEELQGKVATAIDARKQLEKEKKDQTRALATLENKLVEAKKDLQYWEVLFGERPYCNFTHMQEDAVGAVQTAQRATEIKLNEGRQWLNEMTHSATELVKTTYVRIVELKDDSMASANRLLAQASEATAPYKMKAYALYDQHLKEHVETSTNKATALYDQHLKEHVEKARPHYEKHVVPPLDKATAAVAGAVDATKKMYGGIELQFRNTCPKIISLCDDLREKRGLEVPNAAMEALKHSCSEPEETVATFLKATLVLLAILFRGTLWRLFLGYVSLAFQIVWFFSPLRLFVKTSKDSSKSASNSAESSNQLGQ